MATYTILPAFTSGQVLRANGDGSTYAGMNDLKNNLDLVNAQSAYPFRNLLYNGAMQIAQRAAVGSAQTGKTTTGFYTADRFEHVISSLGTWTDTTIAEAPTGSGFRNSYKVECTTADAAPAAGDYSLVRQQLEGQDLQRISKGTSSAQPLVLTFWVRSNVTGTYIVEFQDLDNTRAISKSYTISASATWEKKEITFGADTTGTFDNDNAASAALNFWLGSGTTYTSGTLATSWGATTNANRAVGQVNLASNTSQYWQITGVQLETGLVSTPFEFLPFGDELRRCQRYYEKSYPYATAVGTGSNETGSAYLEHGNATTNYTSFMVRYTVPKRATLTPTLYDFAGASGYISTLGPTTNTKTGVITSNSEVGFRVYSDATTSKTGILYHWTASAEF